MFCNSIPIKTILSISSIFRLIPQAYFIHLVAEINYIWTENCRKQYCYMI